MSNYFDHLFIFVTFSTFLFFLLLFDVFFTSISQRAARMVFERNVARVTLRHVEMFSEC